GAARARARRWWTRTWHELARVARGERALRDDAARARLRVRAAARRDREPRARERALRAGPRDRRRSGEAPAAGRDRARLRAQPAGLLRARRRVPLALARVPARRPARVE